MPKQQSLVPFSLLDFDTHKAFWLYIINWAQVGKDLPSTKNEQVLLYAVFYIIQGVDGSTDAPSKKNEQVELYTVKPV